MRLAKRFGILLSLIVILFTIGYNYMYKEHRNIAEEKALYALETSRLSNEFKNNYFEASEKYLNNVLLVSGKIIEKEEGGIMLSNTIYVQLTNDNLEQYKLNGQYKIKGRCIGYDELLECVKLDQGSIVN